MNLTKECAKRLEPIFKKNNSDIDPYEDYAYVISECNDYGVKEIEVDAMCEICGEETEDLNLNVSSLVTNGFEWTCPKCGEVND